MYEDDVDLDQNGGDGGHLLSVEPMYTLMHWVGNRPMTLAPRYRLHGKLVKGNANRHK